MRPRGSKAMRVGDRITVRECSLMPEVIGARAEIVDMQVQEHEVYRTYPVWARVTSGRLAGKVYGFYQYEVEPLATTMGGRTSVMRIGDAVKVKLCEPVPEVVGETGEIVELETQQFAKYAAYPIWVKITSGGRAGKVYGFRESEVELLAAAGTRGVEAAASREVASSRGVVEQLEEILKGVETVEEIGEVEKVIEEAKGKILTEPGTGFWEGKTPCWAMFRCPEAVRNECPAFKYQSLPCWEIEGTYCKLYDYGAKGDGTEICANCRVYKKWGQGAPIEIKLLGKGFNPAGE